MTRAGPPRGALASAVAGLLTIVGCGHGATVSRSQDAGAACEAARSQRARVSALIAAGKLDRALRVIARCDELCPADTPLAWADQVTALWDIGRSDEASRLADAIASSPSASEAARAAARKVKASSRAPAVDPEALVASGLAAKAAGDAPGAQRLFDRALEILRPTAVVEATVLDSLKDVGALAWSPDGASLAAAVRDGVMVFETSTWRPTHAFEGRAQALAFSPDGRTLAVSAGGVKLLHLGASGMVRTPGVALGAASDDVSTLAFSPDGKTLAVGSQLGSVRMVPVDGGAARTLQSVGARADRVGLVSFSADGKAVKVITITGAVRTISLDGRAAAAPERLPFSVGTSADDPTVAGFTPDVLALARDGKTVVSGPRRGELRLVTIGSPAPARGLWGVTNGAGAAFSPDGKAIAWGSGDAIHVTALEGGAAPVVIRVDQDPPVSLAFAPDGNTLGSAQQGLHLWHLDSSAPPGVDVDVSASSLAFAPDGATLAVVTTRGALALRDAGGVTSDLDPGSATVGRVTSAAFSADSKTVATGEWSGTVHLWDTRARTVRASLDTGVHADVLSVAMSRDGQLAAASRDGAVRVWSIASGSPPRLLQGHKAEVFAVAFAPDGKALASASGDGTRLWPLGAEGAPRVLGSSTAIRSLAFSSDGRWLASAGQLWDITSAKPVRPIEGQGTIFSPDGAWLASIGLRGIALQPTSGGPVAIVLHTLRAVNGSSTAVARTADSHVALLGDGARELVVCRAGARLWPLDVCEERSVVPDLVSRVFAHDSSYLLP